MSDFAFKPVITPSHQDSFQGSTEHWYAIRHNGEHTGHMVVDTHKDEPHMLHISNIETDPGRPRMGHAGVQHIRKQLKAFHPEAKYVSGLRISGARTDSPYVVSKL